MRNRLESEIGLSQYKMRLSFEMSNVPMVCVVFADRLDATGHNAGQHAGGRGANAPRGPSSRSTNAHTARGADMCRS
jgi:hypothetical protein